MLLPPIPLLQRYLHRAQRLLQWTFTTWPGNYEPLGLIHYYSEALFPLHSPFPKGLWNSHSLARPLPESSFLLVYFCKKYLTAYSVPPAKNTKLNNLISPCSKGMPKLPFNLQDPFQVSMKTFPIMEPDVTAPSSILLAYYLSSPEWLITFSKNQHPGVEHLLYPGMC